MINANVKQAEKTFIPSARNLKVFEIDKSQYSVTIWFNRIKRNDGTKYHSKSISFSWMRKIWKINKVKPMYKITNNGATKLNNASCFDTSFYIGYFIFGYTNWSFNNNQPKVN